MSERAPRHTPAATTENTPQPRKKFSVAFVETTKNADERARQVAEASLQENKESLQGVSGFIKKVWKHNLAYEAYFLPKEIGKAKKKILESQNMFADQTADLEAHQKAMGVVVKQFTSEFAADTVHAEAGEKREVLGDTAMERTAKETILRIIREYADKDLNDPAVLEALQMEKKVIVEDLFEAKGEAFEEGARGRVRRNSEMFADNLVEVVRQVQENVHHGLALDALDQDLEVVVGRARADVRTEAHLKGVDKLTDTFLRTRVGQALFNETTVALGVSLAYGLTAGLAKRVASSKAAAVASLGGTVALAGATAWFRERRRMEMDRATHMRERAQGKKAQPGQERREKMEQNRYETVHVGELAQSLEMQLKLLERESGDLPVEAKIAKMNAAIEALSAVEIRVRHSDQRRVDLIQFTDVKNVARERYELDVLRARLKVSLRDKLKGDPELQAKFKHDEWEERGRAQGAALEQDIAKKDEIFNKLKHKEAFKSATKAALTGLVFGAVAQEAVAFLKDDQMGLVERLVKGMPVEPPKNLTALEWLRVNTIAHHAYVLPMNPDPSAAHWIGSNHVAMPEGFSLEQVAKPGAVPGSFALMRNGELVAGNLTVDSGGQFTPEAQEILKGQGIALAEEVHGAGHAAAGSITAEALAKEYTDTGQMKHIQRHLWYDNDTPKKFDLNELKLWWGGKNNVGTNANGDYLYTVKPMTPGGSFHGLQHANAQQLMREGKLTMLLSLSKGTQSQVFEVPIAPDGTAIIDKNSDAARMLFEKGPDGKAHFIGGFAEVAQQMGDKNNMPQVRILATQVGLDKAHLTPERWTQLLVPANPDLDPPPVIPLVGRRPLEPLKEGERNKSSQFAGVYGYEAYGGNGLGLLERSDGVYEAHLLQELRDNPNLEVAKDDKKIVDTYLNSQKPEYRNELKDLVKGSAPFKPSTKVIFAIPAYKEGKNIYKTLQTYAKMENKDEFEIVLFENHPSSVPRDSTGDEIERFKRDYPEVQVVHLYKSFGAKEPIGLIRKYVNDAVLERKQQAGRTDSMVIVSNDADLEDINPKYASRLREVFESNPTLDAVNGKDDFPAEAYKAYPLLHTVVRLQKYFEMGIRRYYRHVPELIGRNSAMRSGIYAAIGGYNPNAKVAEDLEVGWLIRHARGWGDSRRLAFLNDAWIKTNPRRAIDTLQQDERLTAQYRDFHTNEKVRDRSVQEQLQSGRDFSRDEFVREVQAMYDSETKNLQSRGQWLPDNYFNQSFDRAMRFLGVKYEIRDNTVVITDVSKLIQGLERYKQ